MFKKYLYRGIFAVAFFSTGFLFAQGTWISKINGQKLHLNDFNDLYEGIILMMTLNENVHISQEEMKRVLNDKERKKQFLRVLEDQTLVLEQAQKQNLYNNKTINRQTRLIAKVIKNQLILREFREKAIYPNVKVQKKDVQKLYKNETKKKQSVVHQISKSNAEKLIELQLKSQATMAKFREYIEKLRLESQIIRNESLFS